MKLLIATEFAPDAPGGGPAVIRQMLDGLPISHLLWWSVFSSLAAGTCESYSPGFLGKLYPRDRFSKARSYLMENAWSFWAARHLKQLLKTAQPDAIWVIPHNWSIPALHHALVGSQWRWHVTMQDYVDVHGNPQRFGTDRCQRMARMADALYAKSFSRDATSLPMLADLAERTGVRGHQMLHQGLEKSDLLWLGETSFDLREAGPIRIAYAGTILCMEEFSLFARSLSLLRDRFDLEIHFFGAHSYRSQEWFRPEWMREHGNCSHDELLAHLRKCDWGFIPMSLQNRDARYNHFSFPTKFITYLAAGLPVITLAHPETSVFQMAAKYDLGLTCAIADEAELAAELGNVLLRPRGEFRSEILRCAQENFDAKTMRAGLFKAFQNAQR